MAGNLLTGLNPFAIGANIVGGALNVVGAIGQYDEAKRQAEQGKVFSQSMRDKLKVGYKDLISQAKGLPTYTADITKYIQMQKEAEANKMLAGAGGRVAGEDIARQQIDKTQANQILASQRAATSSSDLLASINMGQESANVAQQQISAASQQQRADWQQQAQNAYLNTLGQTAAAQAQQAGMQYQSEYQRAANVLGLGQEQLSQSINLEQDLFAQEQARAAAVQQAKSAIWSGVGGIATGIGTGLMQAQAGINNMEALKMIYKQTPPSKLNEFNKFSSTLGQNPSIGFTSNISTTYANPQGGRVGYSSYLPSATTGTIGQ